MNQYGDFGKETEELMTICERNDRIPPELFKEFGVKRGLRDVDGTGVFQGSMRLKRRMGKRFRVTDSSGTAVTM